MVLKVFIKNDQTYKTLAVTTQTTTKESLAMVAKKLGLSEALSTSLSLVERSEQGAERTLADHETPGALQLQWSGAAAQNKFFAKFSEAGKESFRATAVRRLSQSTPVATSSSTTSSSSSSNSVTPSQRMAADLSALDQLVASFDEPVDDLAILDAVTASLAPAQQTTTTTTTTTTKTTVKTNVTSSTTTATTAAVTSAQTKISKTGQVRMKQKFLSILCACIRPKKMIVVDAN